eukprot:1375670-Amorphochlora_amoeboformis.AAC.1
MMCSKYLLGKVVLPLGNSFSEFELLKSANDYVFTDRGDGFLHGLPVDIPKDHQTALQFNAIHTTTRQHDNTTTRQHDSTTTRQYDSTTARQHDSTTTRQHDHTTTPQHDNTTARPHDNMTIRQHENTPPQHDNTRQRGGYSTVLELSMI